jgi:CHAT domain-containing protein
MEGSRLLKDYQQRGDRASLDQAIDTLTRALVATPETSFDRVPILDSLGIAHRHRYEAGRDRKDLADAINAHRVVLDLTLGIGPLPEFEAEMLHLKAISYNNLGYDIRVRWQVDGVLHDLAESISLFEEAVRIDPDEANRLVAANNLAASLLDRHRTTVDWNDVDRAIDLLTPYKNATEDASRWHLSNLGNALVERHKHSGDRADLDAGIESLTRAVDETSSFADELPRLLSNLAAGLLMRFPVTLDAADLRRAVGALQAALARTSESAVFATGILSNLGTTYRDLDLIQPRPQTRERGIRAFRLAASKAAEGSLAAGLAACKNWGMWALERQAYGEAAEAYGTGLDLMTELFRTQLTRTQKEAWLADAQGVPVAAAYALAKNGEGEQAVEALDAGRALLLSEALGLDQADLVRLDALGHSAERERYEVAADSWNDLALAPAGGSSGGNEDQARQSRARLQTIRAVREELNASIEEIRRIPGYDRFLLPLAYPDIVRAAAGTPVVYLGVMDAEGFALTVRPGAVGVEMQWLTGLGEEGLREQVRSYRSSYEAYLASPRKADALSAWEAAIDRITAWVWDAGLSFVAASLDGSGTAILVPTGLLGVLPLHAAWTADPSAPTGRRYLLDGLTITYGPNARSLAASRRHAAMVTDDHLVAVDEPAVGTEARVRLPFSAAEVAAATGVFADYEILAGADATEAGVLGALDRADVFHLSCHGRADPDSPLDSFLVMAGAEKLTLGEVMKRRLHARLGVLSACETAVPGDELPDEVINLPTGFLETGVGATVGSLWSVPGTATALLMLQFYVRWRVGGQEPATALREAQRWLRDTTTAQKSEELEKFVTEAAGKPGVEAIERLFRAIILDPALDPNERAHQAPYHWAAFTYVGA